MANVIPFPARKPVQPEIQTVSLGVFLGAVFDGDFSFEALQRAAMAGARLTAIRALSVQDLRRMWDAVGDDSFYHGPEGSFDCAEIHRVLNEKGDGRYCAV